MKLVLAKKGTDLTATQLIGLVIAFMLIVTMAGIASQIAKDPKDLGVISNFESFAFAVENLLNDGKPFSYDEVLFAGRGHYVVGFDYSKKSIKVTDVEAGPGGDAKEGMTFKKPKSCYEEACLCLFNSKGKQLKCIPFSHKAVFSARGDIVESPPSEDAREMHTEKATAINSFSTGMPRKSQLAVQGKALGKKAVVYEVAEKAGVSYTEAVPSSGIYYEELILSIDSTKPVSLYVEKAEAEEVSVFVGLSEYEQQRRNQMELYYDPSSREKYKTLFSGIMKDYSDNYGWYLQLPAEDIIQYGKDKGFDAIIAPQKVLDNMIELYTRLKSSQENDLKKERADLMNVIQLYLTSIAAIDALNNPTKLDYSQAIRKYFKGFSALFPDDSLDQGTVKVLLPYLSEEEKQLVFSSRPLLKIEEDLKKAIALKETNPAEAVNLFEEIVSSRAPDKIKALGNYHLGLLQMKAADYPRAKQSLEKAAEGFKKEDVMEGGKSLRIQSEFLVNVIEFTPTVTVPEIGEVKDDTDKKQLQDQIGQLDLKALGEFRDNVVSPGINHYNSFKDKGIEGLTPENKALLEKNLSELTGLKERISYILTLAKLSEFMSAVS